MTDSDTEATTTEPSGAEALAAIDHEARVTKVRPGCLVTLSTSVKGGVKYDREDLGEVVLESGAEVKDWRTKKETADKDEHDYAVATRLSIRKLVQDVCINTPFGLVCPKEDLPKLDAALEECRKLRDDFNADAVHSKVHFATMRGEIAENAAEAVAAVRSEIALLVTGMQEAMATGEVKTLRDLATKASKMSGLLEQETKQRDTLSRCVNAARRIARAIAKKVEKDGESLATVLEDANMSPIADARFAFLDEAEVETAGDEQAEVEAIEAEGTDEDLEAVNAESEIDEDLEDLTVLDMNRFANLDLEGDDTETTEEEEVEL